MRFANDMLNTDWLEDVYLILVAHKNNKVTTEQAKKHLAAKHKEFKRCSNVSEMTDEELWNYCLENRDRIMSAWENLAV